MKGPWKDILHNAFGLLGELLIVCGFVAGLTALIAGIVMILP